MSIITISRGTFSGGEELAKLLSERLGYEVVSREVLTEAAVKYGVSESKLAEAMRKAPGLWDRFLHDRRRYLAFIQCTLCDLASHDRIVYHGNAGHLLLTGIRHVLRVRLIAPLEYRLRQVEQRQGIGRAEAEAYITRVDHDREKWTQWLYGVNWHDPALYDLVVNLEHLDLDATCASIVAIVSRPQFASDEASRQAFADLHLASRVRAALAADSQTAFADVEVHASGKRVEIEGQLPDPRWVQTVLDTARRVEGVGEVHYGTRFTLIGQGA